MTRTTTETVTEGDESTEYRLWAVTRDDATGDLNILTERLHVGSAEEAIRLVAEGWGDGRDAAGLEQFEDGEWREYMDDRGCDLDECVEEHRERDGEPTLQDVLNKIGARQ